MYNVEIKTLPHHLQRYETLGDYVTDNGCLKVTVSSLGNSNYEFLVAIHELCEKQLAKQMGVTEQMIDAWDLNHEDEEEPGALEGCPYREAHLIAEGIERTLAVKLGVDWDHYERTCKAVLANSLPPKDPTVRDKIDYDPRYHDYTQQRRMTGRRSAAPKGKAKARSVLRNK